VIDFVISERFANGDAGNDQDVELANPSAYHGGDLPAAAPSRTPIRSLENSLLCSPVRGS